MVPIRIIAETFGANVAFDDETWTVIITRDIEETNDTITTQVITIPTNQLLPNNMGQAVIINGRTFVPARFVAEAFGADVQWEEGDWRVIITY